MSTAILGPAAGWFAALLIIMIIVTGLFALILWIALKPIKKDELDDSASTQKALSRRETELTIELLKNRNDASRRAELEGKLREVKSAEKLVSELTVSDEEKEQTNAKPRPAQPAHRPAETKPAAPAEKSAEEPVEQPVAAPTKKPTAQPEDKGPVERKPVARAPRASAAPERAPKKDK